MSDDEFYARFDDYVFRADHVTNQEQLHQFLTEQLNTQIDMQNGVPWRVCVL